MPPHNHQYYNQSTYAPNATVPPHFYNSVKDAVNPNINSLHSNIYYPTILPQNQHQMIPTGHPHHLPYVFVQANDVNRNGPLINLNGRQVASYQMTGNFK